MVILSDFFLASMGEVNLESRSIFNLYPSLDI